MSEIKNAPAEEGIAALRMGISLGELNLISEEDMAKLRRVQSGTLRNERVKGLGPPWVKIGRQVFYPLDKFRKYLAASTVTPSSRAPTLIDGNQKRSQAAASEAA